MADGSTPILPPTGGDPAQAALKTLELGRVEVTRVSAELQVLTETARLEAQVVRLNDDGTVTLRTAKGAEIDIKPPVQLQTGQTVQIRVEAGNPPTNARVALPPQSPVSQGQAQVPVSSNVPPPPSGQGQPVSQMGTPLPPVQTAPVSSQTSVQTPLPVPDTIVSYQAGQRYDLPPIPSGTTVPAQFVALPIPPSPTGVEVLLTTLFNAGSLKTPLPSPVLQQNPLSSLAQIAQSALPPPIIEGVQNVQLLKSAFVGRQLNVPTFLSNLYGVQPTAQTLPVTGLSLTQPASSISPLTLIPQIVDGVVSTLPNVINTQTPVKGVSPILSSILQGNPTQKAQIVQPHPSTARVLFSHPPGRLIQVPNFPIATSPVAGQANSLFFGVSLGQNASQDFVILGTNGIATIPKASVTGPLLPGTVLVAQGRGITPSPNVNLFNVPVVNIQSGLLNFDPVFGDQWPVLDEVLNVLTHADPAYAAAVRGSIPSVSNPSQLPTTILFFLAATGVGDIRAWVGDKAFDTLIKAGRGELSTLLGRDFSAIASRSNEQTVDGWRPYMVPMFVGDELHRMQFFTRHFDGGEGDGDGNVGGKKTRFLLNVDQTKLGPLQLDGVIDRQRLDMVLRSDDELSQDMRQGIRAHYETAIKESGLAGAITFEHGDHEWVDVDTSPLADHSDFA